MWIPQALLGHDVFSSGDQGIHISFELNVDPCPSYCFGAWGLFFVMLLMFKGKAKAYITAWPVICVTMSKLEEVFTVVADIE